MEILQYSIRKLISGIPLVLGVTFISFVLMVYFGPDKTYELLGKNPTERRRLPRCARSLVTIARSSCVTPSTCANWRR